MLNLDETVETNNSYIVQRDLYLRGFLYSCGVIVFIDIIRGQIAEVNLLQLIPGLYLILIFISFVFLVYFSDLLYRIPIEYDNNRALGTKTIEKLDGASSLTKFSFLLFYSSLLTSLNSVIPLSLDSFNSYGEKTLENLWSFDDVISLEIVLLTILLVLSQLPLIVLIGLSNEKQKNILPEFWKPISFIIFIASALLTPTIDGYTQLSFAFSGLSLYLIIILFLNKRIDIKFNTQKSIAF